MGAIGTNFACGVDTVFLKVMYLVSPFAICESAKDSVELFLSDVRLGKIFSISGVVDEEEANCVGQLNELFCFDRYSLLTSLALTRDNQYLLVGDGMIHVFFFVK